MKHIINEHLPDGAHLIVLELDSSILEQLDSISLSTEAKEKMAEISHPNRLCEFIAIRKCVQNIFGRDEQIWYSETGKPNLKLSGYKISISHAQNLLAIITHSTREVGIDLQHFDKKIHLIQNRFLSNRELSRANDQTWDLLAYWCAKEALYKYYSKGGVNFKEHLFVSPIPKSDTATVLGHICLTQPETRVDLVVRRVKDNMIAFVQFG